ncbi:MAG TPA: SprT family zinc-dependent metalloprotease [Steroidobacteraceae bacterium]|nr:SprT family zinc-dependent metalloprotease [Steroidobacteraceae bacterium]
MQLSLFESRAASAAFAVRVSARARRLTARVHVGGRVEIVVPVGVGPQTVREFVRRFTPWIDRKVATMQAAARPDEPVPGQIHLGLSGERFAVEWRAQSSRELRVLGDRLFVRAADAQAARLLLRAWLKRAAETRLVPRLEALIQQLGFDVTRVAIRCQRTRWGSCSTRGTISLNACLLFLHEPVVRYLFVHELAHTRQMNHSRRFWRLVESLEPDYRRLDRELLAGWRTVPAWVFDA